MTQHERKAIVLRLDVDTLARIDEVRERLNMDRTRWLRKAINSQLIYAEQKELPLLADAAVRLALQ